MRHARDAQLETYGVAAAYPEIITTSASSLKRAGGHPMDDWLTWQGLSPRTQQPVLQKHPDGR